MNYYLGITYLQVQIVSDVNKIHLLKYIMYLSIINFK